MKYILPGMGANSKMYLGPWHEIKDCRFVDWPPYNQEKSVADLAGRLIKECRIDHNDTLIGSSLGGMVALEIAQLTGTKKVFLIGSAINSKEISLFSKASMPFANRPIIKFSQWISSWSSKQVQQMYSKSDPDFIFSMSKAILNWQGFKGDPKTIYRIHGKKDHFISCPDDCETIEKGGHLIAITHAQQCVDFIIKH
ncbi:MAG: alpha/beta hydrolase [Pseudomonadota bacterium]